MRFLKGFFSCFLIVFFANYILPGIEIMNQTKLPRIGQELIFAIALGALNALIYPLLKLIHHASLVKIGGVAIVINFIAYAVVKFMPLGIRITELSGYFYAAAFVSIGSFLVNFFEMKHGKPHSEISSNNQDQPPPFHLNP